MATLIFILILLTIFHFIYESILLPTFRLELRYKLFKTRDKLRFTYIEEKNNINDKIFYSLEKFINSSINSLPYLNLSLFFEAKKEFHNNDELRKKTSEKIDLIKNSNSERVKEIFNETAWYSNYAFILNMGGWLIYFLPLAPLLLLGYFLWRLGLFALGIKIHIQKILLTPENKFKGLLARTDFLRPA